MAIKRRKKRKKREMKPEKRVKDIFGKSVKLGRPSKLSLQKKNKKLLL